MATVNKDFRLKNGLVVEGSTATVNGKNVITAGVVDAKGDLIVGSADDAVARLGVGSNGQVLTANSSATYGVEWSAPAVVGLFGSSIEFEGSTANNFETTLAVTDPTADRTITLPDISGTVITTGDSGTVTSAMIADGTIVDGDISASAAIAQSKISGLTTDLGLKAPTASPTFTGTVTVPTPVNSTDASTKAYVDSVSQGLHIHESVVAATTANVTLANALENGDTLDGIVLATGNRILVKNQTTTSENGIYVVQASGQPSRALDFDTAVEIDSGDFIFVYSGTVNAGTGWVQTNRPATIGTDPILFTQFSGAGTYLAGTGLTLTGNTFSINTATTVDLSTSQTLTNKTLTSPVITGLTLNDSSVVFEGSSADANETTLTVTNPTADRTITLPDATGTVALTNNKLDAFAATTSAELRTVISDETGSGGLVFATSPSLTTPTLGVASATSINKVAITAPATASTLTIADGKTLTASNTLTFTGTDASSVAFGAGGTVAYTANKLSAFGATTSAELAGVISDETGSGALVFANTPTLVTPVLGAATATSVGFSDSLTGSSTASVGLTETVVDTWSATTYSSAKYLIQLKKNSDIETVEVLVMVDGNNNVYLTVYANMISNTSLGTINADYLSGNVRLLVTATNAATSVKVHETYIKA